MKNDNIWKGYGIKYIDILLPFFWSFFNQLSVGYSGIKFSTSFQIFFDPF